MRESVEKVNYDAITHEILIMERLCANRMSYSRAHHYERSNGFDHSPKKTKNQNLLYLITDACSSCRFRRMI